MAPRNKAYRRILQRSRQARWRERKRAGRIMCLVEVDEAIVDMLVRKGLLSDDAADTNTIANAISCLLKSLESDASPSDERNRANIPP